jgi:hypothetical protein
MSQDSVVGMVTGYGLDDQGVGIRAPVGSRILSSLSSRPALGFTQLPIQWVAGPRSPGYRGRGMKLTSHLHVDLYIYTPIRLHGVVLD